MNKTDLPGLYVHIPFCKTKCPYCDFYSVTGNGREEQWLRAVLKEALLYREEFQDFDSLYIGGGTPSILDNRLFEALLNGLRKTFRFDYDSEITVEMNPDDVVEDRIALYRSLGVNRISLGVQSFNENAVRFLGRRHTAQKAEDALSLIGGAGFAEFGIDLMFGLPHQTMKTWRQTLQKALSFGPAHLSCYQLTIEGDTPFSRMMGRGDLKLPGDYRQARFFLATSEVLSDAGFIHYEVSNFARSPQHLSRHNVKYWHHTPYLGLGPSSHSFLNGRRWWNLRSLDGYLENIGMGKKPIEGSESLSPQQLRLERFLFGFRTKWGVDISELSDMKALLDLDDLRHSRLVELHEKRLVPTTKGYLFADRLPLMVSG